MTLRHMKIFSAVYRTGSVTKAAQELHLAQPSLSVAIRELESYYGVCLFERIGRRMHPTQSGETLYGYASHIVALFDDMEKQMRNWDSLGVLRVGASITIGTYILPALLHEYQMQMPELRIEATIERASGIEQRLIDNTVDIALLERQPEHAELLAIPFMQDELRPVVPCGSPLAQEADITLEQLAEYPFLMREKGSSVRSVLEACFALRQMSIHPIWESASTQAIVKAVGEGLGVAVLPQMLVERDAQEGAVRMLRFREPLRRNLNIVYHRSKYLTRNMERFIELCRRSAAQPCIREGSAVHMKHYTVMLKPASSLCNLRCKYCFYCDVAEQREIRSFGKMTDLTRERILNRLAESLEPGDHLDLAFQGGEPMLAGLEFYRALVQTVSQWDSRIHVSYAIQTNATLLDEVWCEFLKENRFLVGVSYDLLPEQHDAVRVDAVGRGTSRAVERAIALLRQNAVDYNILCTLTSAVARHPQQVWKRIVQMDLHYVQFTPCLDELERPGESVYALSPKRFASFYQTLFPLWLAEYRAGRYRSVKFIDDVVNLLAFGTPTACGLDGVCRPQIVVESDGSVYPCDFYCTDDNVLGNLCEQTVPELLASPKVRAFAEREHRQPELCKACGFRRFCGGGCKRMQREICCAADDSFCGYGCFLRENAPVLEQIALAERRAHGLG